MTEPLYWLVLTAIFTSLQPFPYVLERIARIGLFSAMRYSKESGHGDSKQSSEQTATWAKRAYRAHYNSIEYLAIFAILILTAHLAKIDNEMISIAAMIYFFSRVVHYVIYCLGIPYLRTLTFAVALSSLLLIAYTLLTS